MAALQDGNGTDTDGFTVPITARHFDVLERLVSMGGLQPSTGLQRALSEWKDVVLDCGEV